ncbi:MAG: transglutaminase domain-containing protein [Armatimonadetes bacterium]|nr:transglutaminase domain-containing protein [Armatimonadota bacterium]
MKTPPAFALSRFALAALLLVVPVRGFGAAETASDEYFGVYLSGSKVGWMHMQKTPAATFAGKVAVRSQADTQITVNALGTVAKTVSQTVSYNDPKTGAPLFTQTRTEAAGRVSLVSATYEARAVRYVADIAGTRRDGVLSLALGESFLADPTTSKGGNTFPVGTVITGKTFVPETLSLSDETITVLRKESIVVGKAKPVLAFVLEDRAATGTVTLFMGDKGDTLLMRFPLDMEARRETKAVALTMPSDAEIASRPDLAVAVGIKPTGKPLADARTAPTLRFALRGNSADLPPSDNRQTVSVSGTGADRVTTIIVSANALPASAGVARFAKPGDAPEALRPYLLPSAYISSGDAVFTDLAKTATGGKTDLAEAAAKIAAYVHAQITPDASIATLRTASDIAKDRRGVCREYATFFAAIARSAGIPTRVCVGVVLADGAFTFHAWPEVWVGDAAKWVALEPTWGKPFADATHIKLAQGDITDLYRVTGDMGRYQLEVLP